MYYEWHGEGDPLVLIAGYACDVSLWKAILPTLAKRFRVLIFDNRGVGRSDAPEAPYSIETMGDDVLKLTEALGLKQYALLGHSMGGCIAQYVARKAPEHIRKLILSNTSATFANGISMIFRFFYDLRVLDVPKELLLKGIMPWLYSEGFLSNPLIVRKDPTNFI